MNTRITVTILITEDAKVPPNVYRVLRLIKIDRIYKKLLPESENKNFRKKNAN